MIARQTGLAFLVGLLTLGYAQAAAAGTATTLSCTISGPDMPAKDLVASNLCAEVGKQLEARGRNGTVVLSAETPMEGDWLSVVATVPNPYTVKTVVTWGAGDQQLGQSAEIESGISDASLNQATVEFIAKSLMMYIPEEF